MPLSSVSNPPIVPVCQHSYVLIPASKSYWPLPKPIEGVVEYHRACLKCGELTRCFVTDFKAIEFKKCVGCTLEVCDEFHQCNALYIQVGELFDWISTLKTNRKRVLNVSHSR